VFENFVIPILFTFVTCLFTLAQKIQKVSVSLLSFVRILVALSALSGILIILFCGVDLPYFDSWANIYFYRAPFNIRSLTLMNGGHVIIVPNLILFFLGKFTGWNVKCILFFQWLLLIGFACGISWLFDSNSFSPPSKSAKLSAGLSKEIALLSMLAVGFALSPIHANSFVDDRLLPHILSSTLFILALFFFNQNNGWASNFFAPFICVAMSFTTGWGILTWPAFFPAVLLKNIKHKRWFAIGWWLGCALATIWIFSKLFTTGYAGNFVTGRAFGMGLLDFIFLVGTVVYPPLFIGKLYPVNTSFLFLVGFVLCALQVFVTVCAVKLFSFSEWIKSSVGISLIFCLLSGLTATIGRAEFYPFSSLGMRYVTLGVIFCSVLVVQLIQISSCDNDRKDMIKKIRIFLIAIFLANYPLALSYALKISEARHEDLSKAVKCLKSDRPFQDFSCYQSVYSGLDLPKRQQGFMKDIEFMKKNKISMFRYLQT